MAGGIGTRFWPMSTQKSPKQFHDVLGTGKTLLQQTFERMKLISDTSRIFVITSMEFTDLVFEQLPDLPVENCIAEPMGMNTAACVAYASFKISQLDENAQLLICPSDHLILNESLFAKNVQKAMSESLKKEGLYTLGIEPTRPDTGYGYIQYIPSSKQVKEVKTFTEKPDFSLAKQFIESGDFLWNSGMFIWKVSDILEALKRYLPDMYRAFENIKSHMNTESEIEEVSKIYPTLQKTSIDKGVLEKCEKVFVLPARFGWSDLGTWLSLFEQSDRDPQRNAVVGEEVKLYNAKGNMIHIEGDRVAVIDGLENFIVVNTDDALLICPLKNDQEVKNYVTNLRLSKADKYI
ncbi:MAG: sugar phosphate nucleotidyltransferase [Weeksellaceae bacterium]|nr:sugar phosphate nucleotidyltransferase [Weeksellaceae bacterium]